MSDYEIIRIMDEIMSLQEKLKELIDKNIEDRNKGSIFDRKQYELQKEKERIDKEKRILTEKRRELKSKKFCLEGSAKIKCDCGAIIKINSMSNHQKSKKHKNYFKKQNNDDKSEINDIEEDSSIDEDDDIINQIKDKIDRKRINLGH